MRCTPWQVVLVWLLSDTPNTQLIAGTSSLSHLQENVALETVVTPDVLARRDAVSRVSSADSPR